MLRENITIAPSIFASDFGKLAEEAKRCELAGADCIHVDIMDGHFVPNLTLGPRALGAINQATDLFLDVHIMVYNPYDFIERLVEMGADRITFHFEATEEIEETIEYIKKCNVEVGLAFRPETSAEFAIKYLDKCDLILMMTVPPGFGGQTFQDDVLEKVRFIRETADKLKVRPNGHPLHIQVDGGVDATTARKCIEAGADVLVAGTYVFKGDPTMEEAIEKLRACGG